MSIYKEKNHPLIFSLNKAIFLVSIMILDYFDMVGDAVEFLIAIGSIIGFLGLIVGILGWMFLGQFQRHKMIGVIVVSIILLSICGTHTGLKYFHIY
jgi:hypothetical protein